MLHTSKTSRIELKLGVKYFVHNIFHLHWNTKSHKNTSGLEILTIFEKD